MGTIITVNGATQKDEQLRHNAISKLNELPSEILVKVAELSENPKAQKYFSNSFLFGTLKAFLKN